MNYRFVLLLFFLLGLSRLKAQSFTREELPTQLSIPWEICYGPDGFLWITETHGIVSRVDPQNGDKLLVYQAPDYFNGSPLENSPYCFKPKIGAGTFGLALHPDFLTDSTAYIYFVYSYNKGDSLNPKTRFKVARLLWNRQTLSVSRTRDIVTDLPNGYDHFGGRLMAVRQSGKDYLYLTTGDNGISDDDNPDCYMPQSSNPNNQTQNPDSLNGKVLRFYVDGSIPPDNPIPGNPFYTRGHRNPQGLVYNPNANLVYDIEHGDRSDDEINLLEPGMNYGWKTVRGYKNDSNYPGEKVYYKRYKPNARIPGDSLVDPIYVWCADTQSISSNYLDWCTVAPSDGIYYNSDGISAWKNSILVVTLKNGVSTDQQVYQFNLTPDGKHIAPSTPEDPNPDTYFAKDQMLNGRLRDIAVSPDGKKIYLINNAGTDRDKITVYTHHVNWFKAYPNPTTGRINFDCDEAIQRVEVYNTSGQLVWYWTHDLDRCTLHELPVGLYIVKAWTTSGSHIEKVVRQAW